MRNNILILTTIITAIMTATGASAGPKKVIIKNTPGVIIKNPNPVPVTIEDQKYQPNIFDLVMLVQNTSVDTTCGSNASTFKRKLPDGTVEDFIYNVPKGHVLLVKEFRWTAVPGTAGFSFPTGRILRASLYGLGLSNVGLRWRSSGTLITDSNKNAAIGEHEKFETGLIIGQNQTLCAGGITQSVGGTALSTGSTGIREAQVLGYLISVLP